MSVNLNLDKMAGGLVGAGGVARAARGGCGSVFGVFIGLLLVPLGFYLVYHGEVRLVNHGKVFDGLQMMTPEQAKSATGLVKFSGVPKGDFLKVQHFDGPALYYRITVEEYQEERDSDGDIDYEWNTVSSESGWADFTVGPIAVRPKGANPVGEETVWSGYKARGMSSFEPGGGSGRSTQVGDQRKTVEVLDARKSVIVVGQMASDGVSGGSTFVVSTLPETATSQALHTEYKIAYWLMKVGAVLAIGFGIVMIFGPLLSIVGYIPFIGERLSGLFIVGALFFAVVVVGVTTLLIKLFWVFVVIAVLGIAVLVWKGFTSPRTRPGTGAMPAAGPVPRPTAAGATPPPASAVPQPTPTPAAAPAPGAPVDTGPDYDSEGNLICPKCQQKITEADNFCMNCGAKLDQGRLIR